MCVCFFPEVRVKLVWARASESGGTGGETTCGGAESAGAGGDERVRF